MSSDKSNNKGGNKRETAPAAAAPAASQAGKRSGEKSDDNAKESQPATQASEQTPPAQEQKKPNDGAPAAGNTDAKEHGRESKPAPPKPEQRTGTDEPTEGTPEDDEPVFVAIIEKLQPDEKERLWSKILGQLSARGRDPQVKAQGIYTDLIDTAFSDQEDLRAEFRDLLQRVPPESHGRFLATVSGIQRQSNRPAAVKLAGVVDAFETLF